MENGYEQAGRLAKMHWDKIAKPIDSLGMLEDYVVKLCSIVENAAPFMLDKKAVVCLCADHGVVAEGVTQTDSSVTKVVAENFAKGNSTVNRMSKVAGADVFAFDVGMDCDNYSEKNIVTGSVIDRKLARGSKNLYREPAFSIELCKKAIKLGIDIVGELKEKGYKIIATGEMGIGNTTPTSALAAYFLKLPAEEVTGKGAGLSAEGISRKCKVVETAVQRARNKYIVENAKNVVFEYDKLAIQKEGKLEKNDDTFDGQETVLGVLAEIGGLEIAAMVGVFLGGVIHKLPIMIDGAISAVAALTASRLDERVPLYAIPTHVSEEKTGRLALADMGLSAMLHGRMCLGEGTGAVALMPLLDMAMTVYATMGSFEDYDIEAYHRF